MVKMLKQKLRKILKEEEEKKGIIIYKGITIRLKADLAKTKMEARKQWNNRFKVLKGKNIKQKTKNLIRKNPITSRALSKMVKT